MLLFSFYYEMQVSIASWGDMGLNYLKETSLQKVKDSASLKVIIMAKI